jgi:pimeloyl-ACP methyl ester carboxylesterase
MRTPVGVAVFITFLITTAHAQTTQPVYDQPLGIGLEGLAPPYPVKFLPLEIQGQRLRMAYMDVAPAMPNGRAVLLLHGKNFYGDYWTGTIKALTDAGYRVIVPDQIGFGRSSKPTEIAYSFDLLAANTATLLNHLKVEKVTVVGHSMGGMLAVRFVNNYRQRVTHLVIENMIGLEDYRLAGVPPVPLEKALQSELSKTPESLRKYIGSYFAGRAARAGAAQRRVSTLGAVVGADVSDDLPAASAAGVRANRCPDIAGHRPSRPHRHRPRRSPAGDRPEARQLPRPRPGSCEGHPRCETDRARERRPYSASGGDGEIP